MARLRVFDWVLIVVLTGVWAVLFVRGIGEGLRTQSGFLSVRVSTGAAGEYPTIQTSDGPKFQPGDRLLAVDGDDLRSRWAIEVYDRATHSARAVSSAARSSPRDWR